MKRIKFFAIAACLAISSGAYAQFTNTSSDTSTTSVNTDGWSTLWVEYNPSSFVPKHGDNESFSAFSLGLSKASSVTQSAPVFGLKALLGQSFMIGASYGSDFSEIFEDCHIQTISLTHGTTF